jgi:hypothetical protein
VINVKKGPDDMEKFRDILWQSNIEHKSEQYRNERKVITHEVFRINCDFRVQAKIDGDHEKGHIKIVAKNVGAFEMDVFQLLASEMTDHAVEELAKYLIGRPNQWAEVVKRSQLTARTATLPPKPRPKVEPQYEIHEVPDPEPEPEEKRGLLGSLRSFIKR